MSATLLFLPGRITVTAEPGERLLSVAARAGVSILTSCLRGACYVCKVEIEGEANPVRACLETVPTELLTIVHHYPTTV